VSVPLDVIVHHSTRSAGGNRTFIIHVRLRIIESYQSPLLHMFALSEIR
jgi:hypothetical protein